VDKYPSLKAFSGDGGFRGAVVEYAQKLLEKPFDIAMGIKGKGEFVPIAIRWVVERTLSWISNFRRTVNGGAIMYQLSVHKFAKMAE
jgi:putative transposase